jgi:hypothetical protein
MFGFHITPSLKAVAAMVFILAVGVALGLLLSAVWRGPSFLLQPDHVPAESAPLAGAGAPVKADDILKLAWLADAPMFIDTEQVAAFYDAVVRPEAEQRKITLSLKALHSQKTTLAGEAKTTISLAEWLTTVFPGLDASIEGKVQRSAETAQGREETRTIELHAINSPQRQLVQLALHYVLQLPNRIKIVSDPSEPSWYEANFIDALPRALVFLDLPPGTAFIPMAVELSDGQVVTIYDEAAKAFTRGKSNPNPRPDERALSGERLKEALIKYWKWYAENFDSLDAVDTVEKRVGKGGRIRWIDYRLPLPDARGPLLEEGKTVHLHVSGRGTYDTGVFAYNLIRRGYRHGLRLVGTVKSAPDINVLAIFEK